MRAARSMGRAGDRNACSNSASATMGPRHLACESQVTSAESGAGSAAFTGNNDTAGARAEGGDQSKRFPAPATAATDVDTASFKTLTPSSVSATGVRVGSRAGATPSARAMPGAVTGL